MIPYPDFISKREQFRGEFNDYIDQSANDTMGLIHTCEELFKKKNLSKSDKSEVLSILNKISMSISGNLKFVAKTFDEQMERTTVEAKNEIEAFWQHKLNEIALAAIENHMDEISSESPVNLLESEDENHE